LKGFILQQFSLLSSHRIISDTFRVSAWIISLMISAYLLINLSIPLYESSTHKGYVYPNDVDGGRGIQTSMETRWYNSNHFAPYGNLYYRFSHTLADLSPINDSNLTERESRERIHNFSMKIVSLLSVYALGLFLGWVLWGATYLVPLWGTFFSLTVINIPMWSEWIFRPHPDHLLNLFIAIATYMFARFILEKENLRILILSAMCWGIAMAVKRSTSIFIPGILILLIFPFNKTSLRLTLRYIGYMLLAYLVVGFPQNFGFYKHIKFLLYESSLHSIGTNESILVNLKLVGNQLILILPVVVISSFFSPNKDKLFSRKLTLLVLISFVPILIRKMSFGGDQHTMPLAIGCMILFLVFFLQYFPWRINSNVFVLTCLITGIKIIGISPHYFDWRDKQTHCFKEFDEITNLISNGITSDHILIREPHFPSNENIDRFSKAFWGIDWSKVTSNVKFFGVSYYNISKYSNTPPSDFYGKMLEGWEDKKLFYNSIKNQSRVLSPGGVEFIKLYTGKNCSHELWMAKK
jgi:hypothetical protein